LLEESLATLLFTANNLRNTIQRPTRTQHQGRKPMQFVKILLLCATLFAATEAWEGWQLGWITQLENAAPLLNDKHLNFVELSLDCPDMILFLVYSKTCCNQCQGSYSCPLSQLFAGLANFTNPAPSYWQPDFLPPVLFAICTLYATTPQCQGTRRSFFEDEYDVPTLPDVRVAARQAAQPQAQAQPRQDVRTSTLATLTATPVQTPTPTPTPSPANYLACAAAPPTGFTCFMGNNDSACLACCAALQIGLLYSCVVCAGTIFDSCLVTAVATYSTCVNACTAQYVPTQSPAP